MEIIARAAVFGVHLSVNELNGRLHAEGHGKVPKPLMDQVRTMRDQIVLELTQGAQARLDLARERHKPFLDDVERQRPSDVSGGQWQTAMDGLWVFLTAGHADEALHLGWPRDELYAVPPLWSRVDLCGCALLIGDREVTSITSSAIQIKTASGATQSFYRRPAVDYGLVYETRRKLLRRDVNDDEAHCRAFEFAVRFCRDHNRDLDLETAKQAVMVAIKRSERP